VYNIVSGIEIPVLAQSLAPEKKCQFLQKHRNVGVKRLRTATEKKCRFYGKALKQGCVSLE